MNVGQFVQTLQTHADKLVGFRLPSGEAIPSHFHITEVGRIDKQFIDCGGTYRQAASCLLQAWVATDFEHRLPAGKLAKIFQLAEPILKSTGLPVELEYGFDVAAQYTLDGTVQVTSDEVRFGLIAKRTDCLAREQCGAGECCGTECCN